MPIEEEIVCKYHCETIKDVAQCKANIDDLTETVVRIENKIDGLVGFGFKTVIGIFVQILISILAVAFSVLK
jgi:hypothetical protein